MVAEFQELEFLHLGSTQITDVGLGELEDLKALTNLIATQTFVTDQGVKELQDAIPIVKIKSGPKGE